MFSDALAIWGRALRQGAVWSALIWTVLFAFVLMLVLMLMGAGTIASMFYHPSLAFSGGNPFAGTPNVGNLMGGILVMDLVALAAGPFLAAGVYGLYGQAVAETPITWRSFWTFGGEFYGRAWGVVLFSIIWIITLSVAALLFVGILHTVGIVLISAGVILSWPFVIRMIGGLFVDRRTWSDSFGRMFRGHHYGGLLGGGFLMLFAYAALMLLAVLILRAAPAIGILLYAAIALFLAVAGPVWMFSLYRATTTSGA